LVSRQADFEEDEFEDDEFEEAEFEADAASEVEAVL